MSGLRIFLMIAVLAVSGAMWPFGPTALNAEDTTEKATEEQDATKIEDEDGGFLVSFLENTLSGDNQTIKVNGLEGAFSSRATIREIIVSDDEGVWLTVTGAVLDWNRLALVRGRFSVNELTADSIVVARTPVPTETVDLPTPETTPFALPDLPVSVEIGKLSITRIALAEPVVGLAAAFDVNGALTLADGALDTNLALNRLDKGDDSIKFVASYVNETRLIGLDLSVIEANDGLISTAMGIPGTPPLQLTAKGTGPLEAFAADLNLATDGIDRVHGSVQLNSATATDGAAAADGIAFAVTVSGDVTPLLEPEFHDFFGKDTHLDVKGQRQSDGSLDVTALTLGSRAVDLTGDLALAAGGAPTRINLNGRVAPQDRAEIVLPVGGARTALRTLDLTAKYDAESGADWNLDLKVNGFSRPDLSLTDLTVAASGAVRPDSNTRVSGQINAEMQGLAFADSNLQTALGTSVKLVGDLRLPGDGTLSLSDLVLSGAGYKATTEVLIDGLNSGFQVDGKAALELSDLAQFSGLAGRQLQGSLSANLTGKGTPLGGSFDMTLDGQSQELGVGIEQLDALLTGTTRLVLDAQRGGDGLTLRKLTLDGIAVQADISGQLRSVGTQMTLKARLDDLARILPDLPGPVTIAGDVAHQGKSWSVALGVDAPGGAKADLQAMIPTDIIDTVTLDLSVSEPANGPLSQLLQIRGQPPLALTISGTGPVSDFAADITLSTDAVERLSGQVTIAQAAQQSGDAADPDAAALQFGASLAGDVTPLFPQQFAAFFGPDSKLDVTGQRFGDGRLSLENLTMTAQELDIKAALDLTADGLPSRVKLSATIQPSSGDEVRLPIPGEPVTIRRAHIRTEMNTAVSPDWDLSATMDGFATDAVLISRLAAHMNGQADLSEPPKVFGVLKAGIQGLSFRDAGIQAAVGPTLSLDGSFDLPGNDTLTLSNFNLQGTAYRSTADVAVTDLATAPQIQGELGVELAELARLSTLAGVPLTGSASANLTGSGVPSTSTFDASLGAVLRDPTTGIRQLDALIQDDTRLTLDVSSRPGGINIKQLSLTGTALSAQASGPLGATGSDLIFSATLDELSRVMLSFSGPLKIEGAASQDSDDWLGQVHVAGPIDSYLDLEGRLTADGPAEVHFDTRVSRLERMMPELPGTLTAKGFASRDGAIWTFDADATGPANMTTKLAGQFDQATGAADATAQGNLELAAANKYISPISVKGGASFDLALKGAPAPEAVSGTITTSNVSVAIPQVQNSIQNLGGTVTLRDGQASIAMQGDVRTGGGFSVGGPVSLTAPFDGTVKIDLLKVILTDEVSYTSSANGSITYSGPLTGNGNLSGRIDIGETEINITAAGGGVSTAPIPPIRHVNEPGGVLITRERAGLIDTEKPQSSGPDIGLDIEISAPGRVFVRGRGLDSELGGNIYVRGSTQNIAPSGQIELIRGFLEIFGRRLELSKGLVTLQGSLKPYLEFAATSNTQDGTASLEITGEPDDLEIEITSDPERGTEEALAMLVFGNQFSELSPFKIAQLAASLVKLRGGGDAFGASARDATGADSVSIAEDSSGLPSVGLGGYVADNVYTDVSVNSKGETELNINLGVTDNLTLKGSVDNSGESGIGIFFERDY